MSSVIRCELSIRVRSASKESAAEDLYALLIIKICRMRTTKESYALYIISYASQQIHLLESMLYICLK